jgi:hypothetical protein
VPCQANAEAQADFLQEVVVFEAHIERGEAVLYTVRFLGLNLESAPSNSLKGLLFLMHANCLSVYIIALETNRKSYAM